MARPDTQTRLAVEMIRKRLQHGDYATSALPGERQLAVELGLSRPTVRKALGQLAAEGVLARGATGRLLVSAKAAQERPWIIAFLHPGRVMGESALWRDGVYTAAEERGAVVRTLSYAHYGDAVINAALTGFDGVFLLPQTDEKLPSTLIRRMSAGSSRVVVLDQDESAAGLRSVIVFPFSSGDKLLAHLYALGHRRIDCFNVQPRNPVIEARIAGWRTFLAQRGLSGELVNRGGDGSLGAAYRCMAARIKTKKPLATALYGTTVHASIGAMRALHEAGTRVGRDVSVCAINDEGLGPYLVPSLTSLQTPPRARCLRKAVGWMTGATAWPEPSLEQPKGAPLFIGESTGRAPKSP